MKRTMKIGGGRSITFEDGDGNKVYESLDAWKTEGERRFGADVRKWKFKCPMCGHVACLLYTSPSGGSDPAYPYQNGSNHHPHSM